MADRNRRKSSILKIPKTRAPLQDVNALDVKSSSDDEFTSHTALRRRVSFAGKNFVKEFCSEAEIASVFHAPEYEQLVTSDSSNNTHDTVSDNNSTIQNRTQSSVYRSISIQDDYDPCEQILREYKGNNSTQSTTEQSKPVRKTRFSFGEIKVPTDEPENEISSVSSVVSKGQAQNHVPNGNKKPLQVNPEELVNHDTLPSFVPSAQNLPGRTICGDVGSNVEKLLGSSTMEKHPVDVTKETFAPSFEKAVTGTCHQEIAQPTSVELRRAPTEIREMLSCEDGNMVENVPSHSRTIVMNSTMDFTTALPSVIRENSARYFSDNEMMESENVPSHSKTQTMCSSMEFTTALPSNIQNHRQENYTRDEYIEKYEEKCPNKTVAMSTTMEFTTALPSNIREEVIHHKSENDLRENPVDCHFYENMEGVSAPSHSNSEIMCTSMEFTTALPSNIQTHIQEDDKICVGIGNDDSKGMDRFSNKTFTLSTTMEFTTALPSNIRDNGINHLSNVDISHHSDKGVIENGNSTALSKTKIMYTSKEFSPTLPTNTGTCLPENDINDVHIENDEEIYKFSNKTVAMSTTMEFTTAMPSNIRENVIHHYSNDDNRENFVGHHSNDIVMESKNVPSLNNTQIMCTSMEFTTVLPTIIQTNNLLDRDEIGESIKSVEENYKYPNKTNVSSSAMELTTATPSCIRQNIVQVEDIDKETSIPLNNANALPTSKDVLAHMAPDTRENVACAVSGDEVFLVENNSPHSGLFTVTGVASEIGIQQEVSDKPSLNVDHCDKFMPLLPQAINASKLNNTAGILENSHHLSSRGPVVCQDEIGTIYTPEDFLKENGLGSELRHDGQAILPTIEVSVLNVEESSKVDNVNSPAAQQENSANKQEMSNHKIAPHCSDAYSQVVPKQAEIGLSADQILKPSSLSDPRGDLDSVPNPFQSRPRLLSSPSKQGGIESVLAQASQSQAVSTVAAETCPAVDNRVTLNKKSPLNVFDRKENKLATSAEEQVKQVNFQSDSAQILSPGEKNDLDPFISKPCLKFTPVKAPVVQTILNTQASTNKPCESSVVKDMNVNSAVVNNRKSLGDGPLFDILARNSKMLQDEPPPFHDCPSDATLEISGHAMNHSVTTLHSRLETVETIQVLSPEIQSEDREVRISENFSEPMDCEPYMCVEPSQAISECHKEENGGSEVQRTLDADNCRLSRRSCGFTLESEGYCSEKSTLINSSKRTRDLSQESSGSVEVIPLDSQLSKRIRSSSSESHEAEPSKLPLSNDLKSRLSESVNMDSYSSDVNSCNASLSSNVGLSIDDIIFKSQTKHPQYWDATKSDGTDLWTFKFKCTCLELKVHLKDTLLEDGNIEAYSGVFHCNVNDTTKPIIWWGMNILMGILWTTEWTSKLHHSSNFMDTLQQIVKEVAPIRCFIIETIIQEGTENLKVSRDRLSFDVVSFKCHLWFKVSLKLDFWENYTPDHICVDNVVGNTRESEVKNLITGVKKDIYFLRNYIRDVKDYVRTLEEFCK